MNRNRITKFFYKIPALQFLYQFEWVKRLYQSFFVAFVPAPQYYIEPVNQCNAECIFCSYPILRDKGKPMVSMNDELFNKSLAIIEQEKRPSISLTPTTGEIFMNPRWPNFLQRVLDLEFVEYVHFYTNGVLLNAGNREKFFALRHLGKLSIAFSTGGTDRETYHLMFGKDLFHHVQKNINDFLECLKQNNMTMPVSIDVKIPKRLRTSPSACARVYNECRYPYAFVKIRHAFDSLGGFIQNENIQEIAAVGEGRRKKPCRYLNDVRFAANGEIWLCGCVISELPGNFELRVGHLNQTRDLSEIKERQRVIQARWQDHGNIPVTCRRCTWYVAK